MLYIMELAFDGCRCHYISMDVLEKMYFINDVFLTKYSHILVTQLYNMNTC
jgi:hypothetical protein